MAAIIPFDNNRKSKNINIFLDELISDCKKIRKENIELYSVYYKEIDYFEGFVESLKKISFKGVYNRFESVYNYLKDEEELSSSLLKRLSFVYLYGLDNGILKEKDEYIKTIVLGFNDNIRSIDLGYTPLVKDMLKKVRNPLIKNHFTSHNPGLMSKVILNSYAGDNLLELSSFLNMAASTNFDGQLDNIYDFYKEQYVVLNSVFNSNNSLLEIEDKTDDILCIKDFDDTYKEYYISIVDEFEKKIKPLYSRLNAIYDLSDVFLHFKDSIDSFSCEDLKKITLIRNSELLDTRDIDEINEIYQKRGKKHENR